MGIILPKMLKLKYGYKKNNNIMFDNIFFCASSASLRQHQLEQLTGIGPRKQ